MAQGYAIQLISPNNESNSSNIVDDAQVAAGRAIRSTVAPQSEQGPGNVDKIRDILFGAHIREYENRFARLEESLLKESLDIRDDTKKRLDALETFVKNQFEAFHERLKAEREDRVGTLRQAAHIVSELEGALTKRIGELDEQTSQASRHLRLELLQQSKEFTEDLRRKQGEMVALVDRRFQELHKVKADRTALATLFTELAMRLNDEFQVPGIEG